MTIVEKAAYLKGLTDGLGIDPASGEGKLWNALNDLLGDMAHEIEDLQSTNLDMADVIDEIGEEPTYLEELTCDLDSPEDFEPIADDDDDLDLLSLDEDEDDPDIDVEVFEMADLNPNGIQLEDGDVIYDGVVYDLTCPSCGEEITIDEETLAEGSIKCPVCGELLEFELEGDD